MTADLKIALQKDEHGQDHVNPETMALLLEFGEHRAVCEQCEAVMKTKQGTWCATGDGLFQQIIERPDVETLNFKP